MNAPPELLTHPLLADAGVAHGFGQLGSPQPDGVIRPVQQHGREVAVVGDGGGIDPGEADAVISTISGVAVGVMTADCVPVLIAMDGGGVVAAVHAGWRGIAAGVVPSAFQAMVRFAAHPGRATAVIGPHIGACCYEVDAPVIERLRVRFSKLLDSVKTPVRPGHWMLDLGALVRVELVRAGVAPANLGSFPDACTCCDPARFHSHRRDGAGAGRLLHWIAANSAESPVA
jgi:YfiH family protein